jgi:glycosyltransferase involved in cell wall biosynthesis
MRIALVSQEYPPAAHGGIGTQTRCKADGLVARGHEVYVVTLSPDGKRREEREGSVNVVRLPGSQAYLAANTESAQWIAQSVSVAAALAELQASRPPDLIDFAEWGSEGYAYLLNRTPWNYTPVAMHLHGPLVMLAHTIDWPPRDSEFYRVGVHMEGTCLRLADAIFSSSRCSAEWCAREYGIDASRIPIIHTGIDTSHFRPLDVAKASRPTIVFVGKAVANKGIETLTEAACRLAAEFPNLRLQLIGGGETRVWERVSSIVAAAGLPDLLEKAGVVGHDRLPEYLSRAHVFAAPSVYEGGPGFVYLEAMACGLPVVACSGSGAAEVVIPEENGLLIPPGDMNALVGALRRLLSNATQRDAMGARARRFAVEEADSKVCLNRLDAFYIAAGAMKTRTGTNS